MLSQVGHGWYAYRVGQTVFRFPTLNKAVRHLYHGARRAGFKLSWREASKGVTGRRVLFTCPSCGLPRVGRPPSM
jgi:hypothetical protein